METCIVAMAFTLQLKTDRRHDCRNNNLHQWIQC